MTTLKNTLNEKLTFLSQDQKLFFNKIYPEIKTLKPNEIKTAIKLCERTIVTNEQNKQTLNDLFYQYSNKASEAEFVLGPKDFHSVIDNKLLKSYTEILTKVEVIVPIKKCITEGLIKTAKDKQLLKPYFDFQSFDNETDAKEYFEDNGSESFDVGEDKYQDEAETFCYISDVFFNVKLEALVYGAKQDRGDKIYHVEKITKVEFNHVNEKVVLDARKKEIDRELKSAMTKMENIMKESVELEKYYAN